MTVNPTQPVEPTAPSPMNLLYIVTGGIQAAHAPAWLHWLRANHPTIQVRYVMTHSAMRFTTWTALHLHAGDAQGLLDEWPDETDTALHVDLAQWADAAIVHPATFNFVSRFSNGAGDTPAMLALQCTTAPIVVCPGLPPGGHRNPAYRRGVNELVERPNVTVLPPVPGVSMSTNQVGVGTAAAFSDALTAVEEARNWLEEEVA